MPSQCPYGRAYRAFRECIPIQIHLLALSLAYCFLHMNMNKLAKSVESHTAWWSLQHTDLSVRVETTSDILTSFLCRNVPVHSECHSRQTQLTDPSKRAAALGHCHWHRTAYSPHRGRTDSRASQTLTQTQSHDGDAPHRAKGDKHHAFVLLVHSDSDLRPSPPRRALKTSIAWISARIIAR